MAQSLFVSCVSHEPLQPGAVLRPGADVLQSKQRQRDKALQLQLKKAKDTQSLAVLFDDEPGTTLSDLLTAKLAEPGTGVVTLACQGRVHQADLTPSGQIHYKGSAYNSPTGFAAAVRSQQTSLHPAIDRGWAGVHINGISCADLRAMLHSTLSGQPSDIQLPQRPQQERLQLDANGLPPLPSTLEPSGTAEEEHAGEQEAPDGEADTANWVQCSRCEVWRVVPDEFWPDIEAAGDDDWFCYEATWDVTQYEPYSASCK